MDDICLSSVFHKWIENASSAFIAFARPVSFYLYKFYLQELSQTGQGGPFMYNSKMGVCWRDWCCENYFNCWVVKEVLDKNKAKNNRSYRCLLPCYCWNELFPKPFIFVHIVFNNKRLFYLYLLFEIDKLNYFLLFWKKSRTASIVQSSLDLNLHYKGIFKPS